MTLSYKGSCVCLAEHSLVLPPLRQTCPFSCPAKVIDKNMKGSFLFHQVKTSFSYMNVTSKFKMLKAMGQGLSLGVLSGVLSGGSSLPQRAAVTPQWAGLSKGSGEGCDP